MIFDAWQMIKNRKQHALVFVKLAEDATLFLSTDWCPQGMGVVDHVSGNFEGVLIPSDHPMNLIFRKHSLFGELFTVVVAISALAADNSVVALSEDNMGCLQAVKTFKSSLSYSALAQIFAKVVREKNLTIVPSYMDTDTIPADPISRTDKKDWFSKFSARCALLKIPVGHRMTGALDGWRDLWNQIMRLEAKYSPYPDISGRGLLIKELSYQTALRVASDRARAVQSAASGVRYFLDYCRKIGQNHLLYRGVFREMNPSLTLVNQIYRCFVLWLIKGGHRKKIDQSTGKLGPDPALPSTIISIYSLALIPNKLFSRPVVGLRAMALAKEYARRHHPKDKIYLSKCDLELLLRSCASYFKSIDENDLWNFQQEQQFLATYLVLSLSVFPLYRVGNILETTTSGNSALTLGSFSFVRRQGVDYLRIVLLEKGDRLKKNLAPKRTILWMRVSDLELTAGNIGPYEILKKYLKVFKLDLVANAQSPLRKPASKRTSIFLKKNYSDRLAGLPTLLNIDLTSLAQTDGIRVTLKPCIIRRSAISWHADISPIHMVQRMAGHSSVLTTMGIYAGASKQEFLNLQASHQRRMMIREALLLQRLVSIPFGLSSLSDSLTINRN
jgi:hypothetical protein